MPGAADSTGTISVSEAAERLGRTPQTVRNWLHDGKLAGVQAGKRRIWRVDEASLAPFVPPTSTSLVRHDAPELLDQLNRLMDRELAAERAIRTIEAERDRHRADAAAAREAALRVNAAAKDLREVVQRLLSVLDEQSEALTQLLTPGSPADMFLGGEGS
jgi:excisionase family DNA binding protein